MALKKPQEKSVLQKSTTKSEVRREKEAKRLLEYMREEYDEFEEFNKDEQEEKCPEKKSTTKLGKIAWEESWGDDFLEDDFRNVLKHERGKVEKMIKREDEGRKSTGERN